MYAQCDVQIHKVRKKDESGEKVGREMEHGRHFRRDSKLVVRFLTLHFRYLTTRFGIMQIASLSVPQTRCRDSMSSAFTESLL